ncbi:ketosynthase chain-length factor (plasmid) [Streptomyces sp. NBC_01591]|uniref:ketosynthase chain-length factor n=1 Tax=Streptomyces sp. NBC_01591 TaxID=2975888 RepID=UPI002DDB2626|nr:ketosynthase chain-length factor [Streptomyces sp. NBC_01591]WSD74779.1 ketosynthase chain-length factor [Streptomyces sp. NBC_01591]
MTLDTVRARTAAATTGVGEVAVTGLGVAAPNGVGAEQYWRATLDGVSGIRPVSTFAADGYPVRLAGEIPECDAEKDVARRLVPQTDRMTRLALLASDEALGDAGLDPAALDEYAMGVAVSSTTGGLEFGQRELQALWRDGWESVSAYMSFAWYYAVNTGQISIRHGMRGPGGVTVSEQASGLDSLAYARRRICKGTAVMTAGGLDSLQCPYGMAIQSTAAGNSRAADPEVAYRPFDAEATGWVPGEGGAVLMLESLAGARERGAPRIYGVLAGYGAAFDPEPADSGGSGLRRAASTALADAGLEPGDVDVVFADGAGVPAADRAEAEALAVLFGERGVPVSVPKTMTGRLLSGGAALDVVAALLSIRDGLVPAAAHARPEALDSRVDLVTGRPRALRVDTALVLAHGHGGFASAMVLTRP